MIQIRTRLLLTLAALLALEFIPSARAAITVLNYYRLGENDPGAVNGGAIANATDSTAIKNLTVIGAPVWTNDVSVAAAAHTASSLSAYFAGSQYGTNSVLSTVSDNFGIEAWVKPITTSGDHIIAYNGDTGANGWGLFQNAGLFRGLLGGVTNVGSAAVTLNGWTHLALVRSNGTATLYVNGAASGSVTNAPNAPSGLFAIAAPPQGLTTNRLAGYLDEVRVFTFAPGQFSTKDLLSVAYSVESLAGPGAALAFNGTNDFAQATPTGLTTNNSLTVEGWVYRVARGVNVNAAIASKSASGAPSSASGEWMLGYGWGTDVIFRNYCISNGWAAYNLPSNGDLGQWHHLAGVYDSTNSRVRLYVDGVLRSDLAAQRALGTNGQPVWIGRTGPDYLNGQLDEVRIWRTARTAAEIRYNMGRSLQGNEAGLMAYWRFNENSGLTTADATTNAFTAGLSNSVAWVASTAPFVPSVATQPASLLTSTGATLTARINPRNGATTAWFEWGIGSLYNQQTAPTAVGSGSSAVILSNQLTGLTAGVAYHYRVVASNSLGVARGWEKRFWAPAVRVIGANPLTNLINTAFTDPGATNTASPQLIAANYGSTLALRAEGLPLAWGQNTHGLLNIPSAATNVVAVSEGYYHMLAARGDGRVVGWGVNTYGETTAPANAYDVVAIAAGDYHSLALRSDGSVLGWGRNNQGQINIPPSAVNVTAIAAGVEHSMALRADGSVIVWVNFSSPSLTDIPPSVTNVVAISSGAYHCLALRADGAVIGWGDNTDGQINIPPSATNVIAIASAGDSNLALRSDDTIIAWGNNTYAQLNIPPDATNVVAIAAGDDHHLAVRADGTVVHWGYAGSGLGNIPANLTTLSIPITTNGSVNTAVAGAYQVTYSTTNALGAAASAARTVIVYNGPPAATTLAASSITANTAALNAAIDPKGGIATFYFQYGLTAAYGSFSSTNSLPATNALILTNRTITGLAPGTLYHFRIVAVNSAGITNGGDLTFTTAPISVQNLNDNGPGSLREAILTANTNSGPAVISATNLSGTISLATPLPFITNSITLNGPGMTNLTISGGGTNRVFFIDAEGGAVNINNLTIANGLAKGGKGGSAHWGGGGGLGAGGALFANAGAVTLTSVGFSNNAAIGGAGGDVLATFGAGGGGGFGGEGGNGDAGNGGGGGGFGGRGGNIAGGGGGLAGNGGNGHDYMGGGGGALGNGQSAGAGTNGGAGGIGGGGNGGNDTSSQGNSSGQNGQTNGGGGGGGDGKVGPSWSGGNGGTGGKFGGGGGAKNAGNAGDGGDFGGGGGAVTVLFYGEAFANAGDGGFGGGGGGAYLSSAGAGGFGGGCGATRYPALLGGPGAFGGTAGTDAFARGAPGGGGAALGGAVFVRGDHGASLTLVDTVPDNATLTPGATGVTNYDCTVDPSNMTCATPASSAGSAMFLLGATNRITVNGASKTIAGTIGGWSNAPTTLIKDGSGTLVLSATNTYTGGTLVNAGTLRIDGNIATSSNVTVNSAATLAGAGAVGNLTINTGATLSPGTSPGTMTASNTVWSGAGNFNWQLYNATNASGVGSDLLQVNGSLDLSGAAGFKINLWTLSAIGPDANGNALNFNNTQSRSWILAQTTAGVLGFNTANFIINTAVTNGTGGFANSLGAGSFSLSVVGNNLVLNFVAPGVQASSPLLTGPTMLGNGSFQFDFTNTPGASFTVLRTTNVALPLSNWTLLSNVVVESPAGQFRVTDSQATNGAPRFYRVRSP